MSSRAGKRIRCHCIEIMWVKRFYLWGFGCGKIPITAAASRITFRFFKEREWCRDSRLAHRTRATINFWNAIWVFTHQFTFWLWAVGFVAFPITSGLLAHRLAFRLGGLAVSHTMWLLAYRNTFWAIKHFTSFIWAFNLIFNNILQTSHSGFSHFTSHIAFFGSAQLVWHLGGSHTGSHIAGQCGSSHFQLHWGWHCHC